MAMVRLLIAICVLFASARAAADSPSCGVGVYLDAGLHVGGSRHGGGTMLHNGGGLKRRIGCDREYPAVLRGGIFFESGFDYFRRADTAGLEIEASLELGNKLVGLRLSAGEGDAAPVFAIGPRLRMGPVFAGADLMYLGRGGYHPAAFAGTAIIGLQGKLAVIGPIVTLAILVVQANRT